MDSFNVISRQLKFGNKFNFLRNKLGRRIHLLAIVKQKEYFKDIYLNECILNVFIACCYG